MNYRTKTILELVFIAIFAFLAPLLAHLRHLNISVDSFGRIPVWMASVQALRIDHTLPIWIPNVGHGLNAAIWNQSMTGIDYIAILITATGHVSPVTAFLVYVGITNLLTFLSIRWVFRRFDISHVWYMGLISLLSISYFALVQIYFNFIGINRLFLVLVVVIHFLEKPSAVRLIILVLFNISILPYFGVIYGSFVFLYLELLIIGIFWNRFHSWNLHDLKQILAKAKKWRMLGIYAIIGCYLAFLAYQFISLKRDTVIVSPGRNYSGGQSFDSYLSYGGFSGIGKFLNLMGFGFDPVMLKTSHLDFQLVVSPLFLGLFIVGLTTINLKSQLNDDLRRWILLGIVIFLFTLPTKMFTGVLFYILPGISNVRHISYFSYLLIPICFILSGLINKAWVSYFKSQDSKIASKKSKSPVRVYAKIDNDGLKRRITIQTLIIRIIALSTMGMILIEFFLRGSKRSSISSYEEMLHLLSWNHPLTSLVVMHILFYLLYISIHWIISDKERLSLSRKIRSLHVLAILFSITGQLSLSLLLVSHIPDKSISQDKLDMTYVLDEKLPEKRIDPSKSLRMKRILAGNNIVSGSSNRIFYDSIAILNNEDYCVNVGRTDIMTPGLIEKKDIFTQINELDSKLVATRESCRLPSEKMGIFRNNSEQVHAQVYFQKLSNNKVIFNYKIPQETWQDRTNHPLYFVYFDARSNLGIWRAWNEKGQEFQFTERLKVKIQGSDYDLTGYKIVELESKAGQVIFQVKQELSFLLKVKAILDIIILFMMFVLLLHIQFRHFEEFRANNV